LKGSPAGDDQELKRIAFNGDDAGIEAEKFDARISEKIDSCLQPGDSSIDTSFDNGKGHLPSVLFVMAIDAEVFPV